MTNLASALAIAISYIELRTEENTADDDVRALEDISAHLQDIGETELNALADAFMALGNPEFIESLGLLKSD